MAQIIVENRTFTDRQSGISTDYKYYAVKGGKVGKEYEVPLKQLSGAEKTALEMIADAETPTGDITSRKATEDEQPEVSRKLTQLKEGNSILDDDEGENSKGWFGN